MLASRDQQLPVSIDMLCTYAVKLVKSKFPDLQFNASCGWCQKFLKRHSLTLRMKTSLAQRLPAHLEERITAFHRNLYRIRCSEDFDEELIGNTWFLAVPLIKLVEKVSSSELLAVRRGT